MSIIISVNILPTLSNMDLFNNGDVTTLLGDELLSLWNVADMRKFNLELGGNCISENYFFGAYDFSNFDNYDDKLMMGGLMAFTWNSRPIPRSPVQFGTQQPPVKGIKHYHPELFETKQGPDKSPDTDAGCSPKTR